MMSKFKLAIENIIAKHGEIFQVGEGPVFKAILDSHLPRLLREAGWRLPRGWRYEAEQEGFKWLQCFQTPGGIYRVEPQLGARRKLAAGNTIWVAR